MVDFRKSVLHAHKEEVEEDVVDDDDDDDLDNENSLRSIEAKLDRALSDVSHLTVDNLSNSLSQSLGMKNENFSSNHDNALLDSAILTDLKNIYIVATYLVHTVILPDRTFKKWGLSNFASQSFQGFIGTQNKKKFSIPVRGS